MAIFPRKKIRRRRSGKRNMYFTAETQKAIEEFQQSEDQEEREKLYNGKIKYGFEKLVENLIFVYGFHTPYEPVSHLQSDCVSFLYEKINKWDPERGTKAFSYFNVVAKNWLIMNSKKKKKIRNISVSLESRDDMSAKDKAKIANHQVVPSPDDEMIAEETKAEIVKALREIKDRVDGGKENDMLCIDAIITIFEKVDTFDFLNRRAVFVYMREISGLDRKQLSKSLNTIRKHYREIRADDSFDLF